MPVFLYTNHLMCSILWNLKEKKKNNKNKMNMLSKQMAVNAKTHSAIACMMKRKHENISFFFYLCWSVVQLFFFCCSIINTKIWLGFDLSVVCNDQKVEWAMEMHGIITKIVCSTEIKLWKDVEKKRTHTHTNRRQQQCGFWVRCIFNAVADT